MKVVVVFFFLGTALALPTNANVDSFAHSNSKFTSDVYSEVVLQNDGNVLVSPFSAEVVLALTQSGAAGVTKEEFRKSLYLPETENEVEDMMQTTLLDLEDRNYVLHTANKIYVEDKFEIREDFRRIATSAYQAEYENVEFAESEVVDEINQWVEDETNNKIQNLLQPGDVDASTRLILINALYFQANWSLPFDLSRTQMSPYFTSNDESYDTETMTNTDVFLNFYNSPELNASFLELPFVGEKARMTIILPHEKEGLPTLEKRMKSSAVTPEYTVQYMYVALPKFKIESTIDFGSVLQQLGVKAAFDPMQADFSGIAGSPGDLVLDKVIQKTYIDVNEGGVEAAAATRAGVVVFDNRPLRAFIVDHPFLFNIKVNDITLFEGRVVEPKY